MELPEQDSDPNLTQMTAPVPHQELPKNNVGPTSILKNPSGTSKQKVSESLNNIASLQTGLQLKRSMAEDCHPIEPLPGQVWTQRSPQSRWNPFISPLFAPPSV